MKAWLALPALVLALLNGCCGASRHEEGYPHSSEDSDTIAYVSWSKRVAFVAIGSRDLMAKRWNVADPKAHEWTLAGPGNKPVAVFIAMVPEGQVMVGREIAAGDRKTSRRRKCTGNVPPGTRSTNCQAPVQSSKLWWRIDQNVGYSVCEFTGNPNDFCDSETVQVGHWIYYSDPNCATEVNRVPLMASVCLP